MTGALTYEKKKKLYNSALTIYKDGTVPNPYHKQILMPFGEYTPFANTLPFLKALNPTAGEFVAGKEVKVFNINNSNKLLVSPLICYEDIIPYLARRATQTGANLLVNITNDAWFGNTIAPHQHHMIASFRAIENNRYLLRSTNTGLSAVVDPLGRTIAQIPVFSEGTLKTTVRLINQNTIYSSILGDLAWYFLSIFCACLICYRKVIIGK